MITTILAPAQGVAYVGSNNGVVSVSTGGTVSGTNGYFVTWLFNDKANGNVYACTGGSLVPYFAVGTDITGGTLNAGAAVPSGVIVGAANSINSSMIFLGGTNIAALMNNGTVAATATVPAGFVITDMSFDTIYSQLLVTAVGIGTLSSTVMAVLAGGESLLVSGTMQVTISSATTLNSTVIYQYGLLGTALTLVGTIVVNSSSSSSQALTSDETVTRQNLYTLQFADGTTLYNATISDVQVSQTGVVVTFTSGQTTAGLTFVGAADTTQLSLWSVVQTGMSSYGT
jgi:hypothetical protein